MHLNFSVQNLNIDFYFKEILFWSLKPILITGLLLLAEFSQSLYISAAVELAL